MQRPIPWEGNRRLILRGLQRLNQQIVLNTLVWVEFDWFLYRNIVSKNSLAAAAASQNGPTCLRVDAQKSGVSWNVPTGFPHAPINVPVLITFNVTPLVSISLPHVFALHLRKVLNAACPEKVGVGSLSVEKRGHDVARKHTHRVRGSDHCCL